VIGETLGRYQILARLGEGGMGQVYRARDTRLDRDVALKILPPGFAGDPDRVRRFELEAKAVAALSDPHIVAVYDVGQGGGILYYAAELVEGADLRALLNANRLPLKKTVDLATQVASGLAAAHAKGIVHRDLKPENVLVSHTGQAKVADFGLAKITQSGANDEQSPAAPTVTGPGVVLGTVAYMSPEQAAGRALDFRSDQFSFGSMLYEMLTGRPAFRRTTAVETLSAILREEPEPVFHRVPGLPPPVAWILDRCLAKAPEERYGSTDDLAKDLERVKARLSGLSGIAAAAPARRSSKLRTALLVSGVAAIALVAYAMVGRRTPTPQGTVLRANIDLPEGVELAPFDEDSGATLAFSPDGRQLVAVGQKDGVTALYLRPLDRPDARLLAGTEGARGPFFSPDEQWIGFWAEGHMKRIPTAGGGPTVICDATMESGAAWMADGTVLFSTGFGLLRVSAEGGQPEPFTTPDAAKSEYAHTWPAAIAGTNAVLFSIKYAGGGPQASSVGLLSLETRKWTALVPGASQPRFVAPGFVLVNRSGILQAASFDASRLSSSGPFTAIEEGASRSEQVVSYDVPPDGRDLVYVAAHPAQQDRAVYSIDLQGKLEMLSDVRKAYWGPAVSPDDSKLAVNVWINPQVSEIWVLDLARRTWLKLTEGNNDWEPIWKGTGTLIYARGQGGRSDTWEEYSVTAAGNGAPALLATFPHEVEQHAITPDRRRAVFTTFGASSRDMWTQPLDGQSPARPLLATPADEETLSQSFSPDGRWLAYASNATGRTEVYVMDFPGGTARVPVSAAGGDFPCWSRDGHQIFYWHGTTIMAANVRSGSQFVVDAPRALVTVPVTPFAEFDVASDGKHFYMLGSDTGRAAASVVFVSDLTGDLRAVATH
jgi:eukaryotic-like serine/threonine-protein kinase